jgi:hypothetical protein
VSHLVVEGVLVCVQLSVGLSVWSVDLHAAVGVCTPLQTKRDAEASEKIYARNGGERGQSTLMDVAAGLPSATVRRDR